MRTINPAAPPPALPLAIEAVSAHVVHVVHVVHVSHGSQGSHGSILIAATDHLPSGRDGPTTPDPTLNASIPLRAQAVPATTERAWQLQQGVSGTAAQAGRAAP
ncbi:MAG: hypothetical protein KBF65_04340 [Rubrivivax sp.]|nr:hypothetical protein [Betaproteobacteria bacterium]MBP6317657.1 hypothetical protein [Rubrivivax sp.]MBK9683226.1 hypothetical protein [Betaproteobacteria bacterium]MBL0296384.1 hypothetical protein [Betaproteobacteria bacterium]MBP6462976.1 hypothetical protein [Rubrivivax sp.]